MEEMEQQTYAILLNTHVRWGSVCSCECVSGLKTDVLNRAEAVWHRYRANVCLMTETPLGLGKNRWYFISSCSDTRNCFAKFLFLQIQDPNGGWIISRQHRA